MVGDAETIKVHVHVPRPSAVLAYAETLGRLYDVVIEDMAAQYQQFLLGPAIPPLRGHGMTIRRSEPLDYHPAGALAQKSPTLLRYTYQKIRY